MSFSKRIINLQFQLGQGDFGEAGTDTVTLEGLRCSVNIIRAGLGFSRADIQIWGMKLELMNKLTVTQKFFFENTRYNQVVVSAGDEDGGVAMCFGGTIREAWADGRQPPDVMFHVSADSGQFALNKPVPPVSFKGSVDAALVLSGIAAQMGYQFENGGITGTLSNPYKPGTPRTQLESVCRDIDCLHEVDEANMVVAVWPKRKSRGGEAVRIAPDSGLVAYPSFTQSGIQFTTLYNPSLAFGRPIRMESQFTPANGQWVVSALQHRLEANIPGGQWFTDVECNYLDQTA
jgi:hypothetical protein